MPRFQSVVFTAVCSFLLAACQEESEAPRPEAPIAVTADTIIATFPVPTLDTSEINAFLRPMLPSCPLPELLPIIMQQAMESMSGSTRPV
jgi:hypothetical protein